ncbi:sugar ABC transporter ATP-binding protein [Bradyrhizobium yuanmingense]|uniref:sugar ABC transporter ATP-binding protein n=1 Tax=Bradyrhizobium yuanmingense TaxID=108015 RepID=UPI0023B9134C|nr:sugar ABC transporter ATP-binding protein [Bradyrhizobium yuanmingense]MDF0584941.1 sugar ABC transporter ATP-binding protein [Bradyrhizobium yuanmingense]
MSSEIIKISRLRKSYGPIEVLKGVDLSFREGEIHAFIGANGAGKSTLLGCLSGATTPSSGEIVLNGESFVHLTPRLAIRKGVAIIYQHFQVIEGLSVADNIFLGDEITKWGIVDRGAQVEQARRLLTRLNADIDPNLPLERLSIGERQIVEIARALHLHPKVLILDEPTAALSDREMESLHNVVRQLAKQERLAIVYVTHLLDEIEQIADVVTVLRDGAVVWTKPSSAAPVEEIARAIAPRLARGARSRKGSAAGEAIVRLKDYRSDFTGPVNLDLRRGEIVGLYGLLGSGRTDLVESLAGARKRVGGVYELGGGAVQLGDPSEALAKGVALVASDRNQQSLFGELSALDNLLMPHYAGIARKRSRQNSLFDQAAESLNLVPRTPKLAGSRFSGGNAQKLVMGRWLLPDLGTRVLLLDEPTQGVDIGAREDLYRLLSQFVAGGGAVVVASSDPAEIVAISDRVLILAHGQQIALLDGEIHEDQIVQLAHQSKAVIGGRRQQAAITVR